MAESGPNQQIRYEWYELLLGVKKTVEGLLAAPATNVWSTYGGLNRLRNSITRILNHRLKVTQGPYGSVLDYWNFIRGLRYLAPAYAHALDQMSRLCAASGDLSPGQTWLRQSLLDHSLSSQLAILVSQRQYLHHHYYHDAFLCQPQFVRALLVCLQAVEENRPVLLAELDPALLSVNSRQQSAVAAAPASASHQRHQVGSHRASHVRSASLPVNKPDDEDDTDDMITRRQINDPLAPPARCPKTTTVPIHTSQELAQPSIDSSPESAKDALLQVLSRTGELIERGEDLSFYTGSDKISDPLLNVQFAPEAIHPLTGGTGGYQHHHTMPASIHRKLSAPTLQHQPHHRFHQGHSRLLRSSSIGSSTGGDGGGSGGGGGQQVGGTLELMFDSEEEDKENNVLNSNVPRNSRVNSSHNIQEAILESPDNNQPAVSGRSVALLPHSYLPGSNNYTHGEVQRTGTIIISDHKPKSMDSGVHSPPSQSVLFPTTELQNLDFPATVQKKPTHTRSASDMGVFQRQNSYQNHNRHGAYSPDMASSLPKDADAATFNRPSKGQSLLSFLSSQDFGTCAELDKENAHFSISEALIAAIEQMKWNQILRPSQSVSDDHELMDSDEEIQDLKQQIRIRREVCLKEKARGFPAFCDNKLDPGASPSSTTTSPTSCSSGSSQHASPLLSDSSGEDTSGPDGDVIDAEITEDTETSRNASNLQTLKQSGLSLSMASLYSDIELQRANSSLEQTLEKSSGMVEIGNTVSAESVAISLLKRFSEKQLPKASELQWLVTEKDAPQALLPLPNSYPVAPDENENSDLSLSSKATRLRGNLEWAPPRAQIIFNIHPAPKRKVLLAKQNYCCAGCGAKVEPGYMKRYRYCEYLGKYFCPRCHTNALAYIPGRILRKWDFTKYYVSNFANELLKKMYADPLFSVDDINPGLYRKVRILDTAREYRTQLQHLHAFLQTCRNGQSMLLEFEKAPTHWTNDIHIYSLDDILQLKKNELLPQLKRLVNDAITHVQQCQLCQAKGFICETCNSNDIIYPFELQTVVQCTACKACYHKGCYTPDKCAKCVRIAARKQRLAQIAKETFSSSSDESSDDPATPR